MTTFTHQVIGPLQPFHAAGILGLADVQVAAALMRIGGHHLAGGTTADAMVALGAALCVRALRAGSVCIDLTAEPGTWAPEDESVDPTGAPPAGEGAGGIWLDWPDPVEWVAAAQAHPLVAHGAQAPDDRPLRLTGSLLYLQRYWRDEQAIDTDRQQRARGVQVDHAELVDGLGRLFPEKGANRQRLAAATAALRAATIVAGGPGTGKTTTVARIIALLRQLEGAELSVALAAPTGKAAARLSEAVAEAALGMAPEDRARIGQPEASTLHRLLGWRPDATGRFRHDRRNPLPHDVVIVDETSMVSLPMMARLVEAVRPDARLVLVGDPDQLASIDAGAVLGDLVAAPPPGVTDRTHMGPLARELAAICPAEAVDGAVAAAAASGVVMLDHNYRFGRGIGQLAEAIRAGDPDAVVAVLRAGHSDVEFLETGDPSATAGTGHAVAVSAIRHDVVAQAAAMTAAADGGDAHAALGHLEDHRLLCAHREGLYGIAHWSAQIEAWTQGLGRPGSHAGPWAVGRPLLVTANDYALGLYNGDTGVIVAQPDGVARAAFARGGTHVLLPPARLTSVQTLHAMTIHRGQGSQFAAVTVVLPPVDSPLLTRELLYTAVTRAREHIRLVGTSAAVRAAVERQVRRASGLRQLESPPDT